MGEDDTGRGRILIAGLGNPGTQYRGNRHNVGFMAIDRLAAAHGFTLAKGQYKALVGSGRIAGQPVILVKPQTFMNNSGDAIGPLADYYRVPTENVLVVYDEIDLPFGTLRMRQAGGSGGHNGMKSIIQHLGQRFPRLRLGVGRPPGRMEPAAYVLQNFKEPELVTVDLMLDEATAAMETFVQDGVDLAMTKYNRNSANDS